MFGMASLSGASAGSGVASHFEATTPGNLNLGGGNLNSGGEGLAGVIEAAAVGLSLPAGDYGLEGARERGERRSYSQLAQPLFDEPDTGKSFSYSFQLLHCAPHFDISNSAVISILQQQQQKS
ncbi:hypothetical protein T492DRAFT_835483 [Pavlovales sp. CCMP2436]|nr:hypothetical protein T492DRAFT_835483 [Pavlovales sp. CCMP2436]